ncbi:acetyl-CoA acetyltransferase [Gammaproteobacteria bacterium]|nr:acetyl-CoA acetyltransferase [Gammaproteobacteria bacterium]
MGNRPVLIGLGTIQQKGNYNQLDEALILMDKAFKKAIVDCTNNDITKYINEVRVPKGFWRYRDPGKWVAENNKIKSVKTTVTKVGILQQNLINTACNKIQNGEIKASLILGGESRFKILRSSIENKEYIETPLNTNPDIYDKSPEKLQLDIEEKELGSMAVGYYAILESAFRFMLQNNHDDHSNYLSEIYSGYSKIAAINKDGWIEQSLDKKVIKTESKKNLRQAFPYNKYHCTSWNVNQACAIIICSEDIADKLNIPSDKRVYPLASSENNHMISTLQRPNLIEPAGMHLAAKFIMDICNENNLIPNLYDLYSCFPVAVQMFAKSLKLNDIKDKTVTGAMPFAGGPLNSYVLHSTAKLIEKLRENNGVGIVTGVSGMMTKQSFALWSKNPCIDFRYEDCTKKASEIELPVKLSDKKNGSGKIIGYTILIKDNTNKAIIFVDTDDKKRKLITSTNKNIIKEMQNTEWVGKRINFMDDQLF